ncbi:MAG: tripartite tricarboxylate transporter substrate binding protein [Betaproteobacteria bacterium]|nr:tripartite tricarboxylate transporter substrate binding protein [Betaproteobacteria bacterium]
MICSRFRVILAATLGGLCLAAAAMGSFAQAYPDRPIRLVIPFGAGGPTDILGRVVAQKLSEILPQQMIAENKPGAGGMLAHAYVAKAPADGYTLLFSDTVAGYAVNPILYPKTIQYNPRRDFVPIGGAASGAVFLYVSATLPVKNVKELIALAKSKPGALSYGSAGAGHFPTHIGSALFTTKNGIDVVHIPYKGAGPAMVDVVAGRLAFLMTTGVAAAKAHLDSGKVRALALTGEKRASVVPDVPTFTEAGSPLPEMGYGSTWGIVGPTGLPRNIVVMINEALNKALAAPDVKTRYVALNMETLPGTPEAFADLVKTQMETWTDVLKRANIKSLE